MKFKMRRDFIGIGVPRSGTTWTWQQLIAHPEICATRVKETYLLGNSHMGLKTRERGLENRLSRFVGNQCEGKLTGEYTAVYIYNHMAFENAKRLYPDAKILVSLRNPIARIVTQFKARQWKAYGVVKDKFADWIHSEAEEKVQPIKSNFYVRYLKKWMKAFDGNIQVSLFDDLAKNPVKHIQGVYKFLGVDDKFVPEKVHEKEAKEYNVYYTQNPFDITDREKKALKEMFKGAIENLENLIDRDLSHWLH